MRHFLFNSSSLINQCRTFSRCIKEKAQLTPSSLEKCDTKVLKVAIIGIPNAGKSTFVNNLMDRKVCATSGKAHTTRTQAKAVFTSDDTQIIFVDTPGLVNKREQKKFNLSASFMKDSKNIGKYVDIIGVLHDVTDYWSKDRLDIKIIKILENYKDKPSFLVLNKIDLLKSKRKLLDLTKILTENSVGGKQIEPIISKPEEIDSNIRGWPYFSDIFMVSALTGDGVEDVRNYLISKAKPGKWLFPENIWTDQEAESIILNTVKAGLLNFMPQEVPYKLQPNMEYLNIEESGKITVVVVINCPTKKLSRLLVGNSESRIRNITEYVQKELQDCFHNFVRIKLVPYPSPDGD